MKIFSISKITLSTLAGIFILFSFSPVQAQENIDTIELQEVAQFGLGITQNDIVYYSFLVSPDENYIAIHSSDGIEILALNTQNIVTTIDNPFGKFGFGVFDWSPDSSQIATISIETELSIWDAFTGELIQIYDGIDIGSNGTRAVEWNQPNIITTGSFEYLTWNLDTEDAPSSFDCHPYGSRLWWSPNNEYIATMGGESSLVWICDSQFNQILSLEGYVTVAWNSDNTEIATVGILNTLRVWSTTSGEAISTLEGGENNIIDIFWHPNRNLIITRHLNTEIRIWERESHRIFTLANSSYILGLQDAVWVGDYLVTISELGVIQMWEINSQ